jgi:hypothetical protein
MGSFCMIGIVGQQPTTNKKTRGRGVHGAGACAWVPVPGASCEFGVLVLAWFWFWFWFWALKKETEQRTKPGNSQTRVRAVFKGPWVLNPGIRSGVRSIG